MTENDQKQLGKTRVLQKMTMQNFGVDASEWRNWFDEHSGENEIEEMYNRLEEWAKEQSRRSGKRSLRSP